jgi:type IV secretion system protein VirB9
VKRLCLALLVSTMMTAPALARNEPVAGTRDSRVRVVPYEQDNVTVIYSPIGATQAVMFGEKERILDVALSNTADLRKVASTSVLYLKALRELEPQPFFVKTVDEEGKIRLYAFEVQTRAGGNEESAPNAYFLIRFTYPEDEARRRVALRQAAARTASAAVATRRLQEPPPLTKNYAYVGQGSTSLIPPGGVWDDGQRTYFWYPGNSRLPVPYVLMPDGKEAVVNSSMTQDGLITVHQTGLVFRLRDGDAVLCLFNRKFDPVGSNMQTGTTRPDVRLIVRQP